MELQLKMCLLTFNRIVNFPPPNFFFFKSQKSLPYANFLGYVASIFLLMQRVDDNLRK